MREQIADICRKAKYSIKNFKSDPVNNLEYLIPIEMCIRDRSSVDMLAEAEMMGREETVITYLTYCLLYTSRCV